MIGYKNIYLSWRDCIEILFFSVLCYYCMLWLMKDRQKNLIFYFFGYCSFIALSYYANLSTMFFVLYVGCPSITMLFIVLHQEALQKNFIALRTITSSTASTSEIRLDWQEILVRSCLTLLHKGHSICCVIEQKESLESFIQTSFMFNTSLQEGLLELFILGKNKNNKDSFVWLTNAGIIKSFDALWIPSKNLDKSYATPTSYWHENAALFTSKTDAFILSSNHNEGTFSCIIQGKQIEGLTAHQVIGMLRKYTLSSNLRKGSTYNGTITQKNKTQHPCP